VTAWYAGQEFLPDLLGMPVMSFLLTGILISHLHRLIIPDDVLIQFDLLMMSIVMLETCREMK
jgi:hypothetical protein